MKKRRIFLTGLNTLGFIGTVIINSLASAVPLNGQTTGDVSDLYPNLFVPANITFAIWGVIYTLLTVFIVYNIVAVVKKDIDNAFIDQIGPWFFISSVINSLWIIAWHWEVLPVTLLLMFLLIGSLIKIYLALGIGAKAGLSPTQRFCVHLPFSVYLGWITVATIANITALLVSLNWKGFGLPESFWAVLVILAAVVIGLIMIIRRRDFSYSLVIVWALFGIWFKRSRAALTVPDAAVEIVSMIGLFALLFTAIAVLIFSIRLNENQTGSPHLSAH